MILLPVWWHKFFQTRVDQITLQLESGISKIGDANDSAVEAQSSDHESSGHQIGRKVELLLTTFYLSLLLIYLDPFCHILEQCFQAFQ